MEENLTQKAIDSALKCDWVQAIKLNLAILKNDPEDIDALNRLARAYFENGNITKARTTSKIVLKINPENNIAINSIRKFGQIKKNLSPTKIGVASSMINKGVTFIEEPGKTKVTTLINLGSEKVYTCLNSGQEVLLAPYSHKVSITTLKGEYIGKLTDDLSARLRKLTKGGNKYIVFVKSASKNCVKIFIKEIKRGKDYLNTQSFPRESLESIDEFSS